LNKAHPDHKKYPYLLKDVIMDHPDQAWCIDISVPQEAA
jgi:putative transposase